jgi:hypothetical protein
MRLSIQWHKKSPIPKKGRSIAVPPLFNAYDIGKTTQQLNGSTGATLRSSTQKVNTSLNPISTSQSLSAVP